MLPIDDITEDQLIDEIRTFCIDRDWDQFHGPKDLAIGLVTEASELLELFRFQSEPEVHEMMSSESQRCRIEDELADIYYFLLRFADRHGFNLKTALVKKMVKNAERYPVEKFKGNNKKSTKI